MSLPYNAPRCVVITLDAFGTLYRPRRPIGRQYADVAKAFGYGSLDAEKLDVSFRQAFKQQYAKFPNYGSYVGMPPETWWRTIIENTFKPVIPAETKIPQQLITTLYYHFSSKKAYTLFPDVLPFFEEMRKLRNELQSTGDGKPVRRAVIVGIISNSDNRIKDILPSLGLQVAGAEHPFFSSYMSHIIQYSHITILFRSIPRLVREKIRSMISSHAEPMDKDKESITDPKDDIDFVWTSFDARREKPDRLIFELACGLASCLEPKASKNTAYIHIGDDYVKDYRGAEGSGEMEGLLLARDTKALKGVPDDVARISSLTEVPSIVRMKLEGWS